MTVSFAQGTDARIENGGLPGLALIPIEAGTEMHMALRASFRDHLRSCFPPPQTPPSLRGRGLAGALFLPSPLVGEGPGMGGKGRRTSSQTASRRQGRWRRWHEEQAKGQPDRLWVVAGHGRARNRTPAGNSDLICPTPPRNPSQAHPPPGGTADGRRRSESAPSAALTG